MPGWGNGPWAHDLVASLFPSPVYTFRYSCFCAVYLSGQCVFLCVGPMMRIMMRMCGLVARHKYRRLCSLMVVGETGSGYESVLRCMTCYVVSNLWLCAHRGVQDA
jgi:hypothetical protein